MNEEFNKWSVQKTKGGKGKQQRKKNVVCFYFLSLSLSLSLLLQKNTVVIRCLSRSLAVILYFVVSKMYVRNESNIRSYVALSFLYTLSGAEMIKAKSLPVLSTVALTP